MSILIVEIQVFFGELGIPWQYSFLPHYSSPPSLLLSSALAYTIPWHLFPSLPLPRLFILIEKKSPPQTAPCTLFSFINEYRRKHPALPPPSGAPLPPSSILKFSSFFKRVGTEKLSAAITYSAYPQ